MAVAQTNIKRMLAYSSIGHAGFIFMGVISGTKIGIASVMLYMLAYLFMSIGAFAVIILLRKTGVRGDEIKDFSGFARKHPSLGLCMLIFLVSLIGLPPTAGFIGKMYLLAAAVEAEYYYLAAIGVPYECCIPLLLHAGRKDHVYRRRDTRPAACIIKCIDLSSLLLCCCHPSDRHVSQPIHNLSVGVGAYYVML